MVKWFGAARCSIHDLYVNDLKHLKTGSFRWSTSSIGPYKLPEIWVEPCIASAEHMDPLSRAGDR